MDNILISSNGDYFLDCLPNNQNFDYIIAVDGGIRHLERLNMKPDLWVGDMDSSSELKIDKDFIKDLKIEKLPTKKDMSDTDYAIEKALDLKPKKITMIGGTGNRIDHSLFNINLLLSLSNKSIDCKIYDGKQELIFLSSDGLSKKEIIIENKKGKTLSVVPFSDLKALSLDGFEYPLDNRNLDRYSNLTLSNILSSDEAKISLKEGLCIIIISNGYWFHLG